MPHPVHFPSEGNRGGRISVLVSILKRLFRSDTAIVRLSLPGAEKAPFSHPISLDWANRRSSQEMANRLRRMHPVMRVGIRGGRSRRRAMITNLPALSHHALSGGWPSTAAIGWAAMIGLLGGCHAPPGRWSDGGAASGPGS